MSASGIARLNGNCTKRKWWSAPGRLARDARHVRQRKIARRFYVFAKSVPRGHAVGGDFAAGHGDFEKRERGANARPKFFARELRSAASRDCAGRKRPCIRRQDSGGCDRVGRPGSPAPCSGSPAAISSGRKMPRSRNSRAKYSFGSSGISPSGVRKPAFVQRTISSRENPCETSSLQGRADGALAALKAIIDRGVDHVEAAFDRGNDAIGVSAIGGVIGSPRYVPMPMEERKSPDGISRKCPARSASGKARRVAVRPCGVARPGRRSSFADAGIGIQNLGDKLQIESGASISEEKRTDRIRGSRDAPRSVRNRNASGESLNR